jgi:hypothetical protein
MSFFKRLFTGKDKAEQSTESNQPAEPLPASPTTTTVRPESSNHELLRFHEQVAVNLPVNAQKCVLCSRPTYPFGDKQARVAISDARNGDADFVRMGMKLFHMLEGVECPNCHLHLCWKCIVKEAHGLGTTNPGNGERCPCCIKTIPFHPLHVQIASRLLSSDQVRTVIQVHISERRRQRHWDGALWAIGNSMVTMGADTVDAYFARCFATGLASLLDSGAATEEEICARAGVDFEALS